MSLPAFTERKEGPQLFFEFFYVLACVYRVQRETSIFFPHDITYQEYISIYITEKIDTMLRFKKMDCWQDWNFPFSKSPIGFPTLQGLSRYTREIGGGLWECSY
jgi:hypothetical protein